jgi:hypothetical protein
MEPLTWLDAQIKPDILLEASCTSGRESSTNTHVSSSAVSSCEKYSRILQAEANVQDTTTLMDDARAAGKCWCRVRSMATRQQLLWKQVHLVFSPGCIQQSNYMLHAYMPKGSLQKSHSSSNSHNSSMGNLNHTGLLLPAGSCIVCCWYVARHAVPRAYWRQRGSSARAEWKDCQLAKDRHQAVARYDVWSVSDAACMQPLPPYAAVTSLSWPTGALFMPGVRTNWQSKWPMLWRDMPGQHQHTLGAQRG